MSLIPEITLGHLLRLLRDAAKFLES